MLMNCRHFNIEKSSSILHWFNNSLSNTEMLTVIKHCINIDFSTSTKNNQSDQNPRWYNWLELHLQHLSLWILLSKETYSDLFTHWWWWLPCKVLTSTSGAVWGSVQAHIRPVESNQWPSNNKTGSTPEPQQSIRLEFIFNVNWRWDREPFLL